MCYMILLSTDSQVDLSQHNSDLLQFSRDVPSNMDVGLLKYEQVWIVYSAHGCGCGFRHLCQESVDLGFSKVEDWFPEDDLDIEATLLFVQVIGELMRKDIRVDCIDFWTSDDPLTAKITELSVNLLEMSADTFRFFENYHFIFERGKRL